MKNCSLWVSLALRLAGLEMLERADWPLSLLGHTHAWTACQHCCLLDWNLIQSWNFRFSVEGKQCKASKKTWGLRDLVASVVKQNWMPVTEMLILSLYSFCSKKLASEELEIKNQVMSSPENIPVRVICCSDPFFESPENREWTWEGSTCYTLTNTDSQKLCFLLIESRGCEIAFYSRTWGSKHRLIVEQLNLALSQNRNNDRIWKWMGEAVINLALK